MATKSYIGIENTKNRTVRAIYCHWDGYPEYVGAMLHLHYQDADKINALLNGGDISILGKSIEKSDEHSFETPVDGYTVFYYRDGGQIKRNTMLENEHEYRMEWFSKSDANYIYLYKDGEWWFTDHPSRDFYPLAKYFDEHKTDFSGVQ